MPMIACFVIYLLCLVKRKKVKAGLFREKGIIKNKQPGSRCTMVIFSGCVVLGSDWKEKFEKSAPAGAKFITMFDLSRYRGIVQYNRNN